MAFNVSALQRVIGHLLVTLVLVFGAFILRINEWLIRTSVAFMKSLTGAVIERDSVAFHTQREDVDPVYTDNEVIDEEATRGKSNFPISPEALIVKTKKVIIAEFGSKNPDLLSEDFQFVFPIVGPLAKQEFCTIFGGFKLKAAFPNSRGNYFGFTVDPIEPNRIWFFSRAKMTHTGELTFGANVFPPTGKEVVNTPQILSMSFDTEGRVYKFTGGYSIDRTVGNCGGLGGVFGIIHSLGGTLPFPESKPWRPSLEWEAFAKHVPEISKQWQNVFK